MLTRTRRLSGACIIGYQPYNWPASPGILIQNVKLSVTERNDRLFVGRTGHK